MSNILPCHFQVVGKKYIRLYSASFSEELYPHTENMLSNSSQVVCLYVSLVIQVKNKIVLS